MNWKFGRGLTTALLVAACCAATCRTLEAATIFGNAIAGTNPSSTNPFTAGQTAAANVTVSGIGFSSPGVGANAANDRFNTNSWNTPAIDPTAYITWTMTPAAGFALDFNTLTGAWQRSSTGPPSYALRSSLDNFASDITGTPAAVPTSAGNFSFNLGAAAFNSVSTGITFRLYAWGASSAAGTFSVNDFTFDGTVLAVSTGNNSNITAPASASFGRVMVGQTPSTNITLTKTGIDATTYSTSPSNSGIVVTADGAIAGGAQNEAISVQLQNNANGSSASGVNSFSVTVDNTAADSAGAGQGSADLGNVTSVSATVVADRQIAASIVDLGKVIVGAPTNVLATTLSTTGDDDNFTRVTVGGSLADDGDVTVLSGSNALFDGAADATSRNVSGTFATAGAKSGSVNLSVSGEGLAGEAVGPVTVAYTAEAYDGSTATFLSNGSSSLTIDFGSVNPGSGIHSLADAILNVLADANFTAELDFDSIFGVGDVSVLSTDLTDGEFTALAGGVPNAYSFTTSFDANVAPGTYSATYTLGLSDADAYAGASAAGSQTLSLTITGTVVPEPATCSQLFAAGLACVGVRRRSG